jgi:hypothetical protein
MTVQGSLRWHKFTRGRVCTEFTHTHTYACTPQSYVLSGTATHATATGAGSAHDKRKEYREIDEIDMRQGDGDGVDLQ